MPVTQYPVFVVLKAITTMAPPFASATLIESPVGNSFLGREISVMKIKAMPISPIYNVLTRSLFKVLLL